MHKELIKELRKEYGDAFYLLDSMQFRTNYQELKSAFTKSFVNGMPKCIVANTVKGKGVSFMENSRIWHHANMNEKQYRQAMEELGHD